MEQKQARDELIKSLTLDESWKENQIMRLVLNDWNYLEFYIEQTINYCQRSKIMSQNEIDEVSETRIDPISKQFPDLAKRIEVQSMNQNLGDSIYLRSAWK